MTQPRATPIDSTSLRPILNNTTETSHFVFVEQFGTDLSTAETGQAILDDAGYKLIQFDDGHEEFYNTSTDTNEATTLLDNVALTTADQAAYAALKLQLAGAQNISTRTSPC